MKKYTFTTVMLFAFFIGHSQKGADKHLSNLQSPTSINVNLLPDSANTKDVGSPDSAWRNLYLNGNVYIDGNPFVRKFQMNTLIGDQAGRLLQSDGAQNTVTGFKALYSSTIGFQNTVYGAYALYSNVEGFTNTAIGGNALYSNISGSGNIAVGRSALYKNSSGVGNIAVGNSTLFANIEGGYNVAIGDGSLARNISEGNTAIGSRAMFANTKGQNNVAQGFYALTDNTTGYFNVGLGFQSLANTTTKDFNTGVGAYAGFFNTSHSTYVGANSSSNSDSITNSTALGYNSRVTSSNQVRIGNKNVKSIGGYVNWSNISDGRVKKNIKEGVPGLAFINKLKPVTYNLDFSQADKIIQHPVRKDNKGQIIVQSKEEISAQKEKEQVIYTGFIAQDVEKAAKELQYDFSGIDAPKNNKDLYGLRYAEFVVPLVKAVQELSAKNDSLQLKNNELEQRLAKLESIVFSKHGDFIGNTSAISLKQNTPNPFNKSTSISYSVPSNTSTAQLVITDMTGNVLKTIYLNKGDGQVTFNSTQIAAGTYVYTLYVNGKKVDSKQMVISK